MKLVSVVITTYNRSDMIMDAIENVKKQTYSPIEIIVVDDCSTDNTENLLCNITEITYVRHEKNIGGAAARMTGVNHANGEYIGFLDDDDRWKPGKIEKQIAVVANYKNDVAVITCGAEISYILQNKKEFRLPKIDGNIRDGIFSHGLGTIPSCHLFHLDLFKKMGGYDLDMPAHNEHDIWMKMAENNYFTAGVLEPLVEIMEEGHPKMMTDVPKRINGFNIFYKKWHERSKSWTNPEDVKRFWNSYMSKKMLANTFLLAKQKNVSGVIKFMLATMPYIQLNDVTMVLKICFRLILPQCVKK